MASRKLGDAAISIPANATVLEFKRTDGNASLWPTNTTRIVESDGQVNFMRHLDLDAHTCVKWRMQVARAVAIDKGMPGNAIRCAFCNVIDLTVSVGQRIRSMCWPAGQRGIGCLIIIKGRRTILVMMSIYSVCRVHV